jgi:acetolactate synthase-1/2/3 large subunit
MDGDSFLISDITNFASWSLPQIKLRRPGQWQQSTVLFMIGTGIPYAIGAKVAFPDSRVVLLTGDGSFGFYATEFDTAVRHNLPIVVIVGNNAGWGIEQKFQEALYGKERMVATSLLPTRYDKVVEALGGHGEHVERPDELGPALERAFASGKPACINVMVDDSTSPMMQGAVANMVAAAQKSAAAAGAR